MNVGKDRLTSLDGLRGLAAGAVAFFWHYQHYIGKDTFSPSYPFASFFPWVFRYGWAFVDLFFVISGFVFCYVYADSIAKGSTGFKRYVINRFSRLYPLHFCTLLAVALLQYIRFRNGLEPFNYEANDTIHFILNLFFVSGIFSKGWSFNAPSWSVSVEIFAYIIFFFILYRANRFRFLLYSGFLLLGGLIFLAFKDNFIHYSHISRALVGFFAGCLAYEISELASSVRKFGNKAGERSGIESFFASINPRVLSVLPIVVNLTCALLIFTYIGFSFISPVGKYPFSPFMLVVFVFPSVVYLSVNIQFLKQVLSIKPLVFLGDISYSVYMVHFSIQVFIATANSLFSLGINFYSPIFFIFNILFILGVATLFYRYLEIPFQNYLRRIFSSK